MSPRRIFVAGIAAAPGLTMLQDDKAYDPSRFRTYAPLTTESTVALDEALGGLNRQGFGIINCFGAALIGAIHHICTTLLGLEQLSFGAFKPYGPLVNGDYDYSFQAGKNVVFTTLHGLEVLAEKKILGKDDLVIVGVDYDSSYRTLGKVLAQVGCHIIWQCESPSPYFHKTFATEKALTVVSAQEEKEKCERDGKAEEKQQEEKNRSNAVRVFWAAYGLLKEHRSHIDRFPAEFRERLVEAWHEPKALKGNCNPWCEPHHWNRRDCQIPRSEFEASATRIVDLHNEINRTFFTCYGRKAVDLQAL